MPHSPFYLTALTTLLALVATATIAMGSPVGEGASASTLAAMAQRVHVSVA